MFWCHFCAHHLQISSKPLLGSATADCICWSCLISLVLGIALSHKAAVSTAKHQCQRQSTSVSGKATCIIYRCMFAACRPDLSEPKHLCNCIVAGKISRNCSHCQSRQADSRQWQAAAASHRKGPSRPNLQGMALETASLGIFRPACSIVMTNG